MGYRIAVNHIFSVLGKCAGRFSLENRTPAWGRVRFSEPHQDRRRRPRDRTSVGPAFAGSAVSVHARSADALAAIGQQGEDPQGEGRAGRDRRKGGVPDVGKHLSGDRQVITRGAVE